MADKIDPKTELERIEAKGKELSEELQGIAQRREAIVQELLRLEGEYRAYSGLIDVESADEN